MKWLFKIFSAQWVKSYNFFAHCLCIRKLFCT